MSAVERLYLPATFLNRQEEIADHWFQAITQIETVPLSSDDIRRQLVALTGQVMTLLQEEPFDHQQAQSIGEAVAYVHYSHPDVLAATQKILAHDLVEGLSAGQIAAVYSRLTTLLADIAAGFVRGVHTVVLAEQEQVSDTLISGRSHAEQALLTSEARFRAIFMNSAIGILLQDDRGMIIEANPAFQSMLGYTKAELCGKMFYEMVHPDERITSRQWFAALMQGKYDYNQGEKCYLRKERYIHKAGEVIWVRSAASLVRSPTGKPEFMMSMVEDITEQKQIEHALWQTEAQFRSAFDDTAVGIALVGLDGRWVRVNNAFSRILGFSEQELVESKVSDITYPDDLETGLAYMYQLLSGKIPTYQIEKRYVHKLGRIIWVLSSVSLVRDALGEPLYFISQIQDITERKRVEGELMAARYRLAEEKEVERLHLAQELHDGAAQQILGLSYQLAEFRRRAQDTQRPVTGRLNELVMSLDEMQQGLLGVVTQLRSMIGELRPAGLKELGLTSALEGYVIRLQREMGFLPRIELSLDQVGTGLPELVAVCLFRVAQEALRNAIKHAEAKRILIRLQLKADKASLIIRDDGHGFVMPTHLVEFAQANHFGLVGLVERVSWIGGTCDIRSRVGVGTMVVVRIPLHKVEEHDGFDHSRAAS